MFYTFCMHKHHTRVSYTFKKVSLERFLHFEEEHVTGRFIVRVLEAVKVCWMLFRQKGHIRCQLFCHILHIYILCDFYWSSGWMQKWLSSWYKPYQYHYKINPHATAYFMLSHNKVLSFDQMRQLLLWWLCTEVLNRVLFQFFHAWNLNICMQTVQNCNVFP